MGQFLVIIYLKCALNPQKLMKYKKNNFEQNRVILSFGVFPVYAMLTNFYKRNPHQMHICLYCPTYL